MNVTVDGTPIEVIEHQIHSILHTANKVFKEQSLNDSYEGKALFSFGIEKFKNGLTAEFMYGDTDGNFNHTVIPVNGKKDILNFLKENEIGVSGYEKSYFKDNTIGAVFYNDGLYGGAHMSVFEGMAGVIGMGTGQHTTFVDLESVGCKEISHEAYGKAVFNLDDKDWNIVSDKFGYKGKNLGYAERGQDSLEVFHSEEDQWIMLVDRVAVGIRKPDSDILDRNVDEKKALSLSVKIETEVTDNLFLYGKDIKSVCDFYDKNMVKNERGNEYRGLACALDYIRPRQKSKPAKPKKKVLKKQKTLLNKVNKSKEKARKRTNARADAEKDLSL